MHRSAAAQQAKRWLSKAARSLNTTDPVAHLDPFLDESLPLPPGDQAYRRPHTFEARFNERTPRHLQLGMAVGDPLGPPAARVDGATRAMRHMVHNNFGPKALHWLDGRSDPLRHGHGEAWVASDFDRDGVRQAEVTYSWGANTVESLAVDVYDAIQRAMDAMPSLSPALTSVRCGRSYGSQEVTFRVDGSMRLDELRPLMDTFGLGAQHTQLTNMLAFILGARFTLPPNTALVTLRPTPAGIELRLDVDLEGIPDVPSNVASLLQLQLVERPQSLSALEQWVMAMTPDGFLTPGSLSVLSIVVRPGSGPRLALDLRPSVIEGTAPAPATPAPALAPATPAPPPAQLPEVAPARPGPAASAPSPTAPAPTPAAAGLRYASPWDPRT